MGISLVLVLVGVRFSPGVSFVVVFLLIGINLGLGLVWLVYV